ncbi:hypothetical protein HQ544_00470 [Candidatus Falkowbacteria bacterium]|nr:hypothetical protein [Candidatus Falkowbacteria bacterium]
MKRIVFVLLLGLLVFGGCDATQQMDDMALETSLEVVNEAIAEGRVATCFGGVDDEGEGTKILRLNKEGCFGFDTEEELGDLLVAGVSEAAKCDGLVKIVYEEGEVVYYDTEGGVVIGAGEMDCSISVARGDGENGDGDINVAGTDSEEDNGDEDGRAQLDGEIEG